MEKPRFNLRLQQKCKEAWKTPLRSFSRSRVNSETIWRDFTADHQQKKLEEVIMLSEEKKGHVRVTVDVEINEALMEMMKEGMKNMPPMMMRRWRQMGPPMEEHEEKKE
jgi:hypothetical protein